MDRLPPLRSLKDVKTFLGGLVPTAPHTGWPLPEVLTHCAQSIEYSVRGYPVLRSGLFRATIGPLVKRRFLAKGAMSHDLTAPIAGAPALEPAPPFPEAVARLRQAIETFEAHPGPFAPHLAYGPCTKDEYDVLHALHVADHLRVFGA